MKTSTPYFTPKNTNAGPAIFTLEEKEKDGGWVWAPSQPQALPHQVSHVPLPERLSGAVLE